MASQSTNVKGVQSGAPGLAPTITTTSETTLSNMVEFPFPQNATALIVWATGKILTGTATATLSFRLRTGNNDLTQPQLGSDIVQNVKTPGATTPYFVIWVLAAQQFGTLALNLSVIQNAATGNGSAAIGRMIALVI